MRRPFLALVAAAVIVPAVTAEPKEIKPSLNWTGVVNNEALSKKAPDSGIITDQKSFEAVWKAWSKEKVPALDFKKDLVVVTLALGGPNRPGITATLDEGDLKIMAISTLIGGDAFGYSLAVFPREGIKKVNGKPVGK